MKTIKDPAKEVWYFIKAIIDDPESFKSTITAVVLVALVIFLIVFW